MTSIGTEKISRGYTSRLPLFSLVPVYTRITGAPPSPHSSDGDFKFSSLSPYRPSFSNSSRHSTVVLDSFGDVACPPTVGLTIIAAQAWTHALVITLGIVGFAVIILLVMAWIGYEYEKDREAAEHVRKGGEPRNSREREAKFLQNLQEREEAPHILTCSHGIIRYRPKIPSSLKFLTLFVPRDDHSEYYKKVDATILTLLETDANLDLTKYASDLGIELVDFHRKNALPPPAAPRIFTLKNIVLSYEVKDTAKSHDEIEKQLRLILDAHPSADLNALASDLGITIRNIQRKDDDEGFQPYDMPVGTKSP